MAGRSDLSEVERLLGVQHAIAGHIAAAPSSAALLERVLATIGEALDWAWGAAWQAAPGGVLRCVATWQRPGLDFATLRAAYAARELGPGEGLPGQTARRGEPVWIPDAGAEEGPLGREAPDAGLLSAVAFPVTGAGRTWGVLEFRAPGVRAADDGTRAFFSATGSLLGAALDRAAAMESASEREALHRSVVAVLDEGVLVFGADGRILSANASVERILGLETGSLLGHSPKELAGAGLEGLEVFFEDGTPMTAESSLAMAALRTGEPRRDAVLRMVRADGQEIWVSLNVQPLRRPGAERPHGVVISMSDITARRRAEQALREERDRATHLAHHDRLTGLPNRTLLEEHLALAVARAERHGHSVALLYLDLDDFKLVNDGFGHAAGDQLLRDVAQRLREVTRASDLLARQGGDEFLLLVTDLEEDAEELASSVAGKLEGALEAPFRVGGAQFEVHASIGVSVFPRDAEDGDALMRHADAAMYQAKSAGRGRISVYAPDGGDPRERIGTANRLREAIGRDELALHYEPVVRLSDDAVVALEALVRWQDPERGLLGPDEFLPLAEEAGLLPAIGEWVIESACRQVAAWRAAGRRLRVNLNLSARELESRRVVDHVRGALERHGVPGEALGVEVSETAATLDAARADSVLAALADLGVHLAVDDFGASYASLARLRAMPLEILKINRALLAGIPHDRETGAIVAATIRLAGALGKVPVAEGVETPQQRAFLEHHGCPLGQGFLLGRARPADELDGLLDAAAARSRAAS